MHFRQVITRWGRGVYMMKDGAGHIIYVGKAKNLRRRLTSYFRAMERHTPKTRVMVGKIESIDFLCTGTEKEALLLEESLIKKHKPRYNIVLRDDKRYLLFRLNKRSDFPRLTVTRTSCQGWISILRAFCFCRRGAHYISTYQPGLSFAQMFGPCHAQPGSPMPLLSYKAMPGSVCHACGHPGIRQRCRTGGNAARRSFQRTFWTCFKAIWNKPAWAMEFEKAAMFRDQIRAVQSTVERQAVVQEGGGDRDVVDAIALEGRLCLGILFIRLGRLIGGRSFSWPGAGGGRCRRGH